MKQKDIALYSAVAIVSMVLSIVLSNLLITPKKDKVQTTEVVDPITSEFITPDVDNKYFNKNANDPTQLIRIGDGSNNTPFNDKAK